MSITLDQRTLNRAKQLMLQHYETSGHLDIGLDGKVEGMTEKEGVQVIDLLPADYEINYHTHPPLYDKIFPDHPSVTDYKFCTFVLGYTREVQAHLIFTPKYIYVITARPELFTRVNSVEDYDAVAEQAEQEYLRVRTRYLNRDSPAFEQEWMRAGAKVGLNVRRFGDSGDPYTAGTVTIPLVPIEPSFASKAFPWIATAAALTTVAYVASRRK